MNPADLIALAERVEKATGPDRELDILIWEAVEPVAYSYAYHQQLGMIAKSKPQDEQARIARNRTKTLSPAYTSSLDAAMTLAEKLAIDGNFKTYADDDEFARLPRVTLLDHKANDYRIVGESEAATLALALTAASLRALAAQVAR